MVDLVECCELHDISFDVKECDICELRKSLAEFEKLLDQISSLCGNPNAADGCRLILKTIREFKRNCYAK